jgi:hypothetical protein
VGAAARHFGTSRVADVRGRTTVTSTVGDRAFFCDLPPIAHHYRDMTKLRALLFVALAGAGIMACTDDGTTAEYRNAVTGEACDPDPDTLVPLHGHNGQGNGNGGHNSPTGIPGDNIDDERSGKVDCLGDGDSGQGNDDRFCAPGCDADGCCEVPPDDDDGGGDDPPPAPEPEPEPEPVPAPDEPPPVD